jgi:hypothetical protein
MFTITLPKKMTDTLFSRRTSNRRSTEMSPSFSASSESKTETSISYSLVNNNAEWENLRLKLIELSTASIPFFLEKEEGVKRIRLTYFKR